MPTACPVCGSQLRKPEDEAVWRCENSSCPSKLRRGLEHFASRGAMNIEGMGESLIGQLCDKGLMKPSPTSIALMPDARGSRADGQEIRGQAAQRVGQVESRTRCGVCSTAWAFDTWGSAAPRCWPIISVRSKRSKARRWKRCSRCGRSAPCWRRRCDHGSMNRRNRELIDAFRRAGVTLAGERKTAPRDRSRWRGRPSSSRARSTRCRARMRRSRSSARRQSHRLGEQENLLPRGWGGRREQTRESACAWRTNVG